MSIENKFEFLAKKYFQEKNYPECLKICFQCISIDPNLLWIYELSGYCYLNLGMYSQSRGCFNTCKDLEEDLEKCINYDSLIALCFEKEDS